MPNEKSGNEAMINNSLLELILDEMLKLLAKTKVRIVTPLAFVFAKHENCLDDSFENDKHKFQHDLLSFS